MKFTCVKEHLERALVLAERFTGKNITLPILGNVLFTSDDSSLKVSATNLEYAIEVVIPGKGAKKGNVSVPAKIMSTLIQTVREEKVTLEEKQGNLFVRTERREMKINGLSPDEFPLIPRIKKTASFYIDAGLLEYGLEKTLPAVSFSEFKPELGGIFFHVDQRRMRLAATDTFRLAEKVVELSENGDGLPVSFILPYRVAQEVSRMYAAKEEEIKISVGENQVLIEGGGVRVTSRLLEGNFPDYRGIIPGTHEASCELSRNDCIDAVRASSIFTSKLQEVKLHFKEKTLMVTSTNPEVGEYKTSFPVTQVSKETTLGFNHRYLLDGLVALEGEKCFFGLGGSSAPTLLRSTTDNTFLYILMPIQLS